MGTALIGIFSVIAQPSIWSRADPSYTYATENAHRRRPSWTTRTAQTGCAVIYACIATQVLVWLGLIVTIARHTNPKGDDMEWVAMAPVTVILALGIGPPLAFRHERGLLRLGALLAIAGLIVGGGLFLEILREYPASAH